MIEYAVESGVILQTEVNVDLRSLKAQLSAQNLFILKQHPPMHSDPATGTQLKFAIIRGHLLDLGSIQ
jgi:hypothetical protein